MDAAALVKRGAPSLYVNEIDVDTGPGPNYHRVTLPIPLEGDAGSLRHFVVMGQIQAIAVCIRDGQIALLDGLQRFKKAAVINHVVGAVSYEGDIQAVHDCIKALKGTDLEKEILERYPKGLKLAFTVYRGNEHEAGRAQRAANAHRVNDSLEQVIRSAQASLKAGFSPEEIAEDQGVSVQTVQRWLSRDLDKPKVKKERSKVYRPGTKRVTALRDALAKLAPSSGNQKAIAALEFVLGEKKPEQLSNVWPELAEATI